MNIDVAGFPVDLIWNLMRPLPFADSSVDAVYHEHLLEHFSLEDGLKLTDDFFRVLRPGGILRMGVPDARAYVESYVEDPSGFLAAVKPDRPTPLLAVQELFYWPQHRTMYDHETLELLFRAAGFPDAEHRQFGDSRLDPCPDSEHRKLETLYVEGVKPQSAV